MLVDGVKTDIASFLVKPVQTITFKEGIHKVLRDNMEQNAGHNVPGWLEWNPSQLTAKVLARSLIGGVALPTVGAAATYMPPPPLVASLSLIVVRLIFITCELEKPSCLIL